MSTAHQREYREKATNHRDNQRYLEHVQKTYRFQQQIRDDHKHHDQDLQRQQDLEARLVLQRKLQAEHDESYGKKFMRIVKKQDDNNNNSKYDQFKCPSCNEVMLPPPRSRKPKLLPCYHTVCGCCLKKLLVYGMIICPVCRLGTKCESIELISDDVTMIRQLRMSYVPPPCYAILDIKKTVLAKKLRDTVIPLGQLR
jgi:hypothetical protein